MKTQDNNNRNTSQSNEKGQGKNLTPNNNNNKNPKQGNDRNPWKDPDTTDPKRSPEKINDPYAKKEQGTEREGRSKNSPVDYQDNKQGNPGRTPNPKERITNQGNTEHHSPVNKSDRED